MKYFTTLARRLFLAFALILTTFAIEGCDNSTPTSESPSRRSRTDDNSAQRRRQLLATRAELARQQDEAYKNAMSADGVSETLAYDKLRKEIASEIDKIDKQLEALSE